MGTNGPATATISLRKVECLICQKIVFPPVIQCKNWHLVCNICRLTITKCPNPDCGEETSVATRSNVSEKFLEKYVARCKYFADGSGCLEAFLKENEEDLLQHESRCPLREIVCLIPGCNQNIRLSSFSNHIETVHSFSCNPESQITMNISEIIMNRKGIVNENCGDKTYKCIPTTLGIGETVFLALFRIASLRQSVFEISTVVQPIDSFCVSLNYACKISAQNLVDSNASYKWEGPISQVYPLAPVLNVPDDASKMKWMVCIEVYEKNSQPSNN